MIPGFGANATLYWANIPALAERFHVIAYDPRGAGRSDVPPATSSMRSTPEGRAGQLAAVQEHDTYDRLPEIKAPTLVAHGEEDGIIPVQNGRILAERIPNARLVIYPGAKHIFFVECAAELNAEVAAFLTAPARERVA